jgi:HSP20 family protein
MAEKTKETGAPEKQTLARREPGTTANPTSMLERFADEIDSVFGDFGLGRSWLTPRFRRGWLGRPLHAGVQMWSPAIEVHQQNNELVIRAELPGINRSDINVDVSDDDITISGERRQEQESERGGVYRSERRYGSFSRTIPLPEGAIADQAKATFKDGVLEIRMSAPPEQVARGRRLEIKE